MSKSKNKFSLIATPYAIWSALFIVVPLLIILFFSVTVSTPDGYQFSLQNFTRMFQEQYIAIFLKSLFLAVISTIICLIIGFPIAYIISKMNIKRRNLYIMLFILPMWMNFLLRTYA